MALLRLSIYKREEEWAAIVDGIKEWAVNKKINVPRDGITTFITSEIHKKYFKTPTANCSEINQMKIKKNFKIIVSDDILDKVLCDAKRKGVSHAALITKNIIDPLIPTTESH